MPALPGLFPGLAGGGSRLQPRCEALRGLLVVLLPHMGLVPRFALPALPRARRHYPHRPAQGRGGDRCLPSRGEASKDVLQPLELHP